MTPATVRIEPADARRTAAAFAALAALPLSYRAAERATDAEVVVVSGAAGWPLRARVAAAAGARAVIVNDPGPDSAPLPVDAGSTVIVLAEAWASNPVLASARSSWAAEVSRAGLVEASATEPLEGRELRSVLFAELRAVQRLGMDVDIRSLAVVAQTTSAALARGRTAAGAAVVLSAARSAVASGDLSIQLTGRAETLRVTVPDGRTARPGEAVLTTADRAIELPTRWETSLRAALLEAHAFLGGAERPDPLPSFRAAAAVFA